MKAEGQEGQEVMAAKAVRAVRAVRAVVTAVTAEARGEAVAVARLEVDAVAVTGMVAEMEAVAKATQAATVAAAESILLAAAGWFRSGRESLPLQ